MYTEHHQSRKMAPTFSIFLSYYLSSFWCWIQAATFKNTQCEMCSLEPVLGLSMLRATAVVQHGGAVKWTRPLSRYKGLILSLQEHDS